jgi:hypothetical protein
MLDKKLFTDNWATSLSESNPYSPLVEIFISWVLENNIAIDIRADLAQTSNDEGILAMLALDKAHNEFPGDIRYFVALNRNTSLETLEMIAQNEDRSGWIWEDYLDYENDDWTEEVDLVADYGADLAKEITELCSEAAQQSLNSRMS